MTEAAPGNHGGETSEAEEFELTGGALCLDLANSFGDRERPESERLHDYAALLRWSRQAGLLDQEEYRTLVAEAEGSPKGAETVFSRALELREAIYRIFSALANEQRPAQGDIDHLNAVLRETLPHLEVRCDSDTFDWCWGDCATSLDRMIWPVAQSAAELLTSKEAGYLRECASETCTWLFVDRSRTKRRKWCDMAVCGNRAKARRHYARKLADRTGS